MSDIILIPGLWLDGSSWDAVLPTLEKAGHRPHPVTLPGMHDKDEDRSAVTVSDLVGAVGSIIDAATGPVVVVGHSASAGLAMAAADARPDRVSRMVYIGGFPASDGSPILNGFTVDNGEIALPSWDDFDDADLRDLDDAALARFRERAIPSPGCVTSEPLRLNDERRYAVPATVVCPEFTADQLREWIAAGEEPVAEFTRLADVEYVDLPTGHWPQFTRPDDLGRIIVDAAGRSQRRDS